MCGLFASIGLTPESDRIDLVSHRGPDGRGWCVYSSPAGPVALGHRRLAIIDISDAGLQPMSDMSGRYHLVFNGELYNYVELRSELRAKGVVFATKSDSEVLLRAYIHWGESCLVRLRGMFAFLIWDDQRKQLFAARDRYGIKPLYVVKNDRGIAFGSEIKQLLGLPGVSGRMNLARAHDFLSYGITDHTDDTLFDGVQQLRGGEFLLADAANSHPEVSIRRWYPVGADDLDLPELEAAVRFQCLLRDAVKLHLRSDVPVGSCLSGGLDSSSIVSLMASMMPSKAKMNTISACYDEQSVDERPFVDQVVAQTGATAHFVYPQAEDLFQKVSAITWHQDEPFGSTSIFAQWCVFEEARRVGIKVMLDGQGADEQLAGYHYAFPFYLAQEVRRGHFGSVIRTMFERRANHGVALSEQATRLAISLLPISLVRSLRRPYQVVAQHDWLGTDLIRACGNSKGPMQVAVASLNLAPPRDLRSLCIAMTFASNLQMLLHWEDRNSMAHSIEARVPFLDHPLVEFSLALGNNHKIVGAETKRVLRSAMANLLPHKVLHRRDKLGFATPEQTWFRGPLRDLMYEGVEATLALYPAIFNAAGTRALRDSMLDGKRPVDFTLWRIANFGIWGRCFSVSY